MNGLESESPFTRRQAMDFIGTLDKMIKHAKEKRTDLDKRLVAIKKNQLQSDLNHQSRLDETGELPLLDLDDL